MPSACVLFAVFAMTMANATVFATVGLFARDVGLSELQVGAIFVSSAVLFLFTSARWGRLADRAGRSRVVVVGLVGTAISLFLFAAIVDAASGVVGAVSIFAAFLGARMIYGLLAGGTQPAAVAHMADVTTAQARSAGAARVGAAVGLGSIAGPLSVALLTGCGIAAPLLAGAVVASLAAVLMVAVGRESRQVAPIASEPFGRLPSGLAPFLVIAFAMHFAFAALQPTNAFYIQDHLRIDTVNAIRVAGLVSMSFAACSFVVQAAVVPRLGVPARRLLAIGLVLCLGGVAACLVAPTWGWLLAGFGLLGIGFGFAQPGLVAGASLAAGARQAEAAGLLQAVMSAAWIAGALAGTGIYGLSIVGPLMLAALATLAALLVSLRQSREADFRSAGRDRLL